ncbi:N-formylglutamate amidohydrolase [Pelagibius sp.]|uniref:N-formylglutamate amidohydrolase n=1 Tax=Pelagibius sp. TaxID=1931238 RepID=UPI003B500B87
MAAKLQATDDGSLGLLGDLDVVEQVNVGGHGDFLVVCEHAANHVPLTLGNLGLSASLLQTHIAWDSGARGVAEALALALDAPMIAQRVSRLVYDCNRPPESAAAIPEVSEIYPIPGNSELTAAQRQERVDRIYMPFRTAVADHLRSRCAEGRPPVLVTVHSFTPVYRGVKRSVDIGVVCDTDSRLAEAVLRRARDSGQFDARLNEPYGPADEVTHTLVEHALPLSLLNVMIEVRSDLIADSDAQAAMAAWLAECLMQALSTVNHGTGRRSVGR